MKRLLLAVALLTGLSGCVGKVAKTAVKAGVIAAAVM